ncbi:DEAD/DEAH box helicase [Riemerella anatipestifer]|nr:DEAD/DEAH box helicase [Riemerella anatipestifer]
MIELTSTQKLAIKKLERLKVGALFMKMGTGKTLTACHLIYDRWKKNKCNFILWIAPNNTLKGSKKMIQDFSKELYENIHFENIEAISLSDSRYLKLLKIIEGKQLFIVIDESLTIKNPNSRRTNRLIYNIGAYAKYKLILNGTPISKNPMDLWAQMHFLSPKILNMSLRRFQQTFFVYRKDNVKHLIKTVNLPYLMSLIEPYVFDADLIIDLERKYHPVFCTMSGEEALLYEEKKQEVVWEQFGANADASFFAMVIQMQRFYLNNCKDLIEKYREFHKEKGKHIVFVRFLSDIENIATDKHLIITGNVRKSDREKILKEFENSDKSLILTYGCGAFGLNLQFCNQIAFYSHQFDYALREQAEYRIYRMGQSKNCHYYSFFVDTGLEKIIQLSLHKKKNTNELLKEELEKIKDKIKTIL